MDVGRNEKDRLLIWVTLNVDWGGDYSSLPFIRLWYCYLDAPAVGAPVLDKGGSFVPRTNQGGLHKNRVGKSMTSNDSVIVFVLDDHPISE